MNIIKRFIFCALTFAGVTQAFSGITPVPVSKLEEYNKRTGGVVPPPTNSAKLLVIDARKPGSHSFTNNLAVCSRHMDFRYQLKLMHREKDDCPLTLARKEKKNGAAAVMFFFEDDDLPVLSVYPEEAITLLNTKPLYVNDDATYRRRLNKEFWRSLAFTLGGYSGSPQANTVLAPVFSIEDLDKLRTFSLSPHQLGAITYAKTRLRMYGEIPVPYLRACREGWAPAPTNDIQKAIWDKVHQLPAEPIKIKPETKKVER